jgi:hypothetical protein
MVKSVTSKFIKQLEMFLNDNPRFLTDVGNLVNKPRYYNKPPPQCKIKVEISHLVAECVVEINETHFGYQVLIHDEYPKKLQTLNKKSNEFTNLMALYFFHELIHVVEQNLGMKHNVVGLRSFGLEGEGIVLHLDIQADRKAVTLAKHFLNLTETELANIQSRSLEDFPTRKGYSADALWRKNRRFVASRLNYIALQEGYFQNELSDPNRYLYAAWQKSDKDDNADFALSIFGAQIKYLGIARITNKEVKILDAITLEKIPSTIKFKILDKILTSALTKLHLGGGNMSNNMLSRKKNFEKKGFTTSA